MNYTVVIEKRVLKDMDDIPLKDVDRICALINDLQGDARPFGCRQMQGYPGRYRLKQGRYRVIYEIDEGDKRVRVMLVGHRKDVYRGM